LSASDTARELTLLARCFGAAFTSFAEQSQHGPPAARVGFATASRVLGEHAQAFAALVPESVLLAPARADGATALLPAGASTDAVLEGLDRSLTALQARATPVADGAVLRAASRARADLAHLGASLRSLEQPPGGSDLV
jgi:hypothetical protein